MQVGPLLGSTSTRIALSSTLESVLVEIQGADPGYHRRQIAYYGPISVEILLQLAALSEKGRNKLCYKSGRIEEHRNLRLDPALGRRDALITPACIGKSEWN